jgi:SAM-dependent methyltransferase
VTTNESYTLGYGKGAMQWMESRTAEGHGAFLLPYLQSGMRLLDCGCGPGTLTLGFAERIAPGAAIGIDLEMSQSAATLEVAQSKGISNLEFQAGDLYSLPFEDGSFDVVFGSAVLGSVSDTARVVAEMTRVLRHGGILALKEFDHGGDIIWPQPPIIARSVELYHRLRAHNGHEALAGRRLLEYMHAADCSTDFFHVFYDVNRGGEQLRTKIDRNNHLITEMLGPQYEKLGWSTRAELEEAAQAWIEFAADPTAVYLSTWFEAVGTKQ